jgi:sortase A
MAKKGKSPELSEAELRRLLLERRRQDRERRLEAFLREGELLPTDSEGAETTEGDLLAPRRVHPADKLKLDAAPRDRPKSRTDRLLLFVEILAVIGLGIVFINGLNALAELNTEVAALFEDQPAGSPTPLLQAVVLPSGHTPPGEAGGARPNEAEIPQHLRPQLQSYTASIVVPTPGPQHAISIRIDALEVSAPVVQGDGWEELKRGVGQHIGSANPGENGNLVLAGHNDIFGEVFRHLDQLKPGDEIVINSEQLSFTYVVASTLVVSPTAVEVMAPTPTSTLTLISCYPYLVDNQRIIIQAELKAN